LAVGAGQTDQRFYENAVSDETEKKNHELRRARV